MTEIEQARELLNNLPPDKQRLVEESYRNMSEKEQERFRKTVIQQVRALQPKPRAPEEAVQPRVIERQPGPLVGPAAMSERRLRQMAAFVGGFTEPTGRLLQLEQSPELQQTMAAFPKTSFVGELAGFVPPFAAIASTLPATWPAWLTGAASFGAYEAVIKPRKGETRLGNAAWGLALGGTFPLAIKGIGWASKKAIGAYLKRSLNRKELKEANKWARDFLRRDVVKGEGMPGAPTAVKKALQKAKPEDLVVVKPPVKAILKPKVAIPKKPVSKVAGKQPWEMTRGEVWNREKLPKEIQLKEVPTGKTYRGEKVFTDRYVYKGKQYGHFLKTDVLSRWHKDQIQKALAEGRPVPKSVLKDYPDLITKPAIKKPVIAVKPPIAQQPSLKALQSEYTSLAEKEVAHQLPATGRNRMAELSGEITKRFEAGEKGTTLAFMGTNPEIMKAAGEDAVRAARVVSYKTAEMMRAMQTPPKVLKGVKEAKLAMIDHDRMVRDSEFLRKQITKVVNDVVPDKERQMLMTHAMEHPTGKEWQALNEIEKGVVRFLRQEKTKLNKFIRDNDVHDMLPEDKIKHIFHSWINPKTGKPFPTKYGKFSVTSPQGKQRVIEDYRKGIELGMKPSTTNPGELIGMQWEADMAAHQSRQMFKTLHNISAGTGDMIVLSKGGKPHPIRLIEGWEKLNKQGLTEGYERYSHPALDRAITFKNDKGHIVRIKGAVGIHENLFPFVKAYMENPTYAKYDQLNFVAKQLKLAGSFFHAMMLGAQEAANFRIPFKNIKRGLDIRKALGPELRILHREGFDIGTKYEDIGGKAAVIEGGKPAKFVRRVLEGMRSWLFDYVQPGMKTSFVHDTFNKTLPGNLKKYSPEVSLSAARAEIESGKVTTDAIIRTARDAVEAADGHFSHEHVKRSLLETTQFMVKMYFLPGARKFWQRILLAPTWQREHLLVGKNVMKSFMTDKMIKRLGMKEMGAIKREYRRYLLGAIMQVGAADVYNLIMTKRMDGNAKHIWENPEGKGFAVRLPWNEPDYTVTDKNGKERTIKGGPAFARPLKSVFELAEFTLGGPFKKIANKMAPLYSALIGQLFPSMYDRPRKGWFDIPGRVKDLVLDASLPISVSQGMDALMGKKDWKSAFLPFMGFPTSKVREGQFMDYLLEADGPEAAKEYIRGLPSGKRSRLWSRYKRRLKEQKEVK